MRKQFLIILLVVIVIGFSCLAWYNHKNNTSDNKINNLINTINNTELEKRERINAAIKLKELKAQEAFKPFIQIVTDKSENIDLRYNTARGLGVIGNREAVPVLSELLIDSQEDEHLRIVVALALGEIGGNMAIKALSAAVDDDNYLIRLKVLQVLGKTKDPAANLTILKGLEDQNIHVRATAIHALGEIGNTSSIEVINQIITNTDDVFIKISCLEALNLIGGEDALKIINEYKNDPNQLLRINAERALKNWGK